MQQRIPYIDVIKGIAISLVVGGHVLERGFLFQSGFCYVLYNFIYSFHVPLFFLGSGLLITQKLTYKKIISKTISLLVPFFIVGSIYTLLALWGIERSGFFNGREKWAKGFENQRV